MKAALTVLIAALALAPGLVCAMRCPGGLVDVGTTKLDLVAKCGPPVMKEITGQVQQGGRWLSIEQWTYDQGPNSLPYILEILDGAVVSIKTGTRH